LRTVASRVSGSDTGNVILLDNASLEENDYDLPEPRIVDISSYIPDYVSQSIYLLRVQKSLIFFTVVKYTKCSKLYCFN
jgi:myosin-5